MREDQERGPARSGVWVQGQEALGRAVVEKRGRRELSEGEARGGLTEGEEEACGLRWAGLARGWHNCVLRVSAAMPGHWKERGQVVQGSKENMIAAAAPKDQAGLEEQVGRVDQRLEALKVMRGGRGVSWRGKAPGFGALSERLKIHEYLCRNTRLSKPGHTIYWGGLSGKCKFSTRTRVM